MVFSFFPMIKREKISKPRTAVYSLRMKFLVKQHHVAPMCPSAFLVTTWTCKQDNSAPTIVRVPPAGLLLSSRTRVASPQIATCEMFGVFVVKNDTPWKVHTCECDVIRSFPCLNVFQISQMHLSAKISECP